MNAQVLQVLGWASAGITVAATGAAVVIVSLIMSPRLAREIDDDLRNNRRC